MTFSLSIALVALALSPFVSAHGIVTNVKVNNDNFPGNVPFGPNNPSIIRLINDPSPVKGADNPSINCGPGAQNAAISAGAVPGDVIKFDWTGADRSKWPHNTGPMFTYMANCGDVCEKFDSRDAKWFKIQQVGREGKGQPWAQQAVMDGATADVTLPNVAPGNYLIRHEIIALHIASSPGGAEFYPSCAQLVVKGQGTGVPQESELVSFPGAYSDNHPGIVVNAFDVNADYDFPGPPIAAFVNGGPSGNPAAAGAPAASQGSGKPAASQSAAKPQSTGAPGTAGSSKSNTKAGSCKLVKTQKRDVLNRPRHFSRVMRDFTTPH